jgi:hypothetical protein
MGKDNKLQLIYLSSTPGKLKTIVDLRSKFCPSGQSDHFAQYELRIKTKLKRALDERVVQTEYRREDYLLYSGG